MLVMPPSMGSLMLREWCVLNMDVMSRDVPVDAVMGQVMPQSGHLAVLEVVDMEAVEAVAATLLEVTAARPTAVWSIRCSWAVAGGV